MNLETTKPYSFQTPWPTIKKSNDSEPSAHSIWTTFIMSEKHIGKEFFKYFDWDNLINYSLVCKQINYCFRMHVQIPIAISNVQKFRENIFKIIPQASSCLIKAESRIHVAIDLDGTFLSMSDDKKTVAFEKSNQKLRSENQKYTDSGITFTIPVKNFAPSQPAYIPHLRRYEDPKPLKFFFVSDRYPCEVIKMTQLMLNALGRSAYELQKKVSSNEATDSNLVDPWFRMIGKPALYPTLNPPLPKICSQKITNDFMGSAMIYFNHPKFDNFREQMKSKQTPLNSYLCTPIKTHSNYSLIIIKLKENPCFEFIAQQNGGSVALIYNHNGKYVEGKRFLTMKDFTCFLRNMKCEEDIS